MTPTCVRAQPVDGQPGSFSRQGVGARALGLAGSFAGIADDASALYWNPAGLAILMKPELMATHIVLFSDTTNDFVGFGSPIKRFGAIGAGHLRQSSGKFQKRATPFDSPTAFSLSNSMSQVAWAIGLPAAYSNLIIPGEISLGLGIKHVAQKIDMARGSGLGADAGLLYRHQNGFSMGVVVQNFIPPSVSFLSKAASFPRVIDVAPTYARVIGRDLKATVAVRTNYFEGRLHPAAGSELSYRNRLAIRIGMEAKGISSGIGVRIYNYQLDYTILLHAIAQSHIVSFSLRFGMTGPELAEEIKRGMQRLDQGEAKRIAHNYYLEGLNFAKEGNLTAAASNLEKSDLLDPANKQVEVKLEDLKAELAQKLNRQLAESSVILARQQYQQGNILVSLEYWKAVLQLDPANEEAIRSIDVINSRLGSQERETLARAQRDILDVQILQFLTRARSLMGQGLLVEAAAETKKALKVDSGHEPSKILRAELHQAMLEKVDQLSKRATQAEGQRDFKTALAAYQAILQMFPDSPGINEKLRVTRIVLYDKVKPELKKEAERLYYVAVDQYLKKQYLESSKTLSRIFELDPGSEGPLKLKAKVDLALK